MQRSLLSIHDVSPKFLSRIDRLHDHLTGHAGGAPLALLVVPDHWRESPIANDTGFGSWLRDRRAQGDEIILHGWSHRDEVPARGRTARFKGQHMTAGEGEFLNLDGAEALRRLKDGRSLLEDMIGAPVEGFVAPAWLYGEGAKAALARTGFRWAEDHFRVWSPIDGRRLATGPVISWATRTRPRLLSSLAFAGIARAALGGIATVRIAVHPGDTTSPAVMASIARTVDRFGATHRPGRYADLLSTDPAMTAGAAPIRQEHA